MDGLGHLLLTSMDGPDQECKGSNGPGHSYMFIDGPGYVSFTHPQMVEKDIITT